MTYQLREKIAEIIADFPRAGETREVNLMVSDKILSLFREAVKEMWKTTEETAYLRAISDILSLLTEYK